MGDQESYSHVGLDVLYWRGSAEILTEAIQLLDKDGFIVHQVGELEEVLDFIERHPPVFVLVDGTTGEADASKRVVEISSSPKLHSVPIVFFGKQAVARTKVLSNQIPSFLALDMPLQPQALLKHIRTFTGEIREKQTATPERKRSSGKIRPQTVAGFQLASASKLLFFDEKQIVPDHPEREKIEALLTEITDNDHWSGLHARRTSFLCSAMANIVELSEARNVRVRTASLLLSAGFQQAGELAQRVDLFGSNDQVALKQVVLGLREASKLVKERMEDSAISEVIDAAAALVERKALPDDKTIIEDAQFALAADMADRACWSLDFWNPRGAHLVLRKLREGLYFLPEKNVTDSLGSIMGQAVILDYRLTNVYRVSLSDTALDARRRKVKEALEAADNLFKDAKNMEVPLYELKHGMRLSRPLVTRDGEIICEANVALDEDMIWRLWQLAGVRPLEPTAFVTGTLIEISD